MKHKNIDQETGEIKNYGREMVEHHFPCAYMRTPYNYDTDEISENTGLTCPEPTRTQQQFKDDADINTIVSRFEAAGEMPPLAPPTEQDFTEVYDFQSAQNTIVKARESFMSLPAKTRAEFNNDPQRMMEFLSDEDNRAKAIKMGLINKPPEPERKEEIKGEIKEKEGEPK